MASSGRQKQPAVDNKTERITFRLTLADKLLIEQNAREHQAVVGDFVRAAALRRQPSAQIELAPGDRELWLNLAHLSDVLDHGLRGVRFSSEVEYEITCVKREFDEVLGRLLGTTEADADAG